MAVEFSFQNVIGMLGQVLFGGSTEIAGLAVMLVVFFIALLIMSRAGAPVEYSMVPMIPLAIFFGYLGIFSTELSFIIIIITAVIVGVKVARMTTGE